MTESLLATKIHIPPSRPNLVHRNRLLQRLDEGLRLGRRLTLVSAPAGYGKTTMIAAWVAQLRGGHRPSASFVADVPSASSHRDNSQPSLAPIEPVPVAWFFIDEDDNDPVRFFTYLIATLQRIDRSIGIVAANLAKAPCVPSIESLVTELINDITALPSPVTNVRPRLVLVLDDYHMITSLVIHKAIELLLERQPPQMHLVLATRQDPPLPLSRMRARDQVTEIRQNDLQFTHKEAVSFLQTCMGFDLASDDMATLSSRTEGWIAGLQMAALSMQGRDAADIARFIAGFSGKHHFILDYLTDEILERQPGPVQTFLLRTSILRKMCGLLCDEVVEQETVSSYRSQDVLEMLQRSNLFVISLDDERQWYRYHHLFADLLQARLNEKQADDVSVLHRCASAWFERNGFASEAVYHALATLDFSLAVDVVDRVVQKVSTWSHVDSSEFLEWLNQLPSDAIHDKYTLRLLASRALFSTGQMAEAEVNLRNLEISLQSDTAPPNASELLEKVASERISYAAVQGEVRTVIEHAEALLSHLPDSKPAARIGPHSILGLAHMRAGNVVEASSAFTQAIADTKLAGLDFVAVLFLCNLADAQLLQGQLHLALKTCKKAIDLGTMDGRRATETGFADLVLSRIHYEWSELQEAEHHSLEGLERLSKAGIPASFGTGQAVLAQIKQAQGHRTKAEIAINRAVQLAQSSGIPRLVIQAKASQARLWLSQDLSPLSAQGNELDLATRWAVEYAKMGPTEYLREYEDLTLARVHLARGEARQALDLLDILLSPAEIAGRQGNVIEIQSLRALALYALDGNSALGILENALQLAEPEGYVRLFVDLGQPMASMLRALDSRTSAVSNTYLRMLRHAFGSPLKAPPRFASHPQSLVESLTGRELQVLQLLARGLTNAEIGQQLVISLPTVKSHTRNIYGKLDVHSRRQAVTQAKKLGILPSP